MKHVHCITNYSNYGKANFLNRPVKLEKLTKGATSLICMYRVQTLIQLRSWKNQFVDQFVKVSGLDQGSDSL